MPIKVVCPQCGHSLNAPDTFAGKVAGCPACKAKLQVPQANGQPARLVAGPTAAPPKAPSPAAPAAARASAPAAPPRPPAPRPAAPRGAAPLPPPQPAPPFPRPAPPPPGAFPAAVPTARAAVPTARAAVPTAMPAAHPTAPAPVGGDLPFSLDDAGGFGGLDLGGVASGPPLRTSAMAKQPVSMKVPLIMGGLTLVVLALAAVTAFLYLGGKGNSGAAGLTAAMRYLPDAPDFLGRIDVQAISKSGLYQKLKGDVSAALKGLPQAQAAMADAPAGFSPEDIEDIYFGGTKDQKGCAIIRSKKPIDFDALKRDNKAGDEFAMAKIDDRTILVGSKDVVEMVQKRGSAAGLTPAIQNATIDANFNSPLCVCVAGKLLGAAPGLPFDAKQVISIIAEGDVGSDINLRVTILFRDATAATQLKTLADAQLAAVSGGQLPPGTIPPAAEQILKGISISQDGAKLKVKISIPGSALDGLSKGLAGG